MQKRVEEQLFQRLVEISGKENVITSASGIEDYTRDMADYEATPAVVVRPRSEQEVVEIIGLAIESGMPVLPRGAGSSLTGAAVLKGAIMLDMRGMSRVVKVDTVNWYVQVQPGISLEDLNRELKASGFFFPPDPASSYICTVGGAIAEGSGGLRCVRYGTMKDWVVALRVVLPNGKVTRLGEPLAKNRAGYDLVHLMVGSEGTLGVITEAWLKIVPLQSVRTRRFLVTFNDWESTGEVIRRLRSSKILPYLFEFLDRDNIQALNEKLEASFEEAEATLMVDVEEGEEVQLATEIFRDCGARRIILAKDEEEAETFYQARSMAYLAVKSLASGVQVEDVVLPIDRLGEFLKFVKEVASKYGIKIPVNGHAGDGNVHPTILYDKSDEKSRATANLAYEELCRKAIAMGGSVTGEHGVGVQKTRFLREQLYSHEGEEALRLMKEIKKIFDPDGLMNPGKYVEAA
ncbi:MAG: FAD-binding oxidoreductase [Thaumarchaeota archaeon]|nr:FAD-binding oxidoreductase [Nitrososphaerota archaeon]